MQFHLRHLFVVTGIAALVAFAISNPSVGVPVAFIAAPAAWRWFHWIGDDLPHFTPTDRALEIGFALFVSLVVELLLIVWAGVAALATWLSVLVIASFCFGGFTRNWEPSALVAVAPAAIVYLAVYVWIYRRTLRH